MKVLTIITLALILFSSCKKSEINFQEDKVLTSIYSHEEIKEIKKMVIFVDERVRQITGKENIIEAYEEFWLKFKNISSSSDMIIPFKDEEKYSYMETLDKNTLESFFKFDNCFRKVKYQDSIYTNLCGVKYIKLSYDGKFMKYLKEAGKTNSALQDIHSLIESSGDVYAGAYNTFAHYYKNIDINSTDWRLLSTLYILKMEEPIQVKIGRYFEEKNN